MKIERASLTSKVGRRIFLLFVLCALIPLTAMAVLSFIQVARQLEDQSRKRLHQTARGMVMAISDRLALLEAETQVVAAALRTASADGRFLFEAGKDLRERLGEHLTAVAVVGDTGYQMPLFGSIQNPPELRPAEGQRLSPGKAFLSTEYRTDQPTRVFMAMPLDPEHPDGRKLLAELNTTYLWGQMDMNPLPPNVNLSILDQWNNVIFSSLPRPVSFSEQQALDMSRSKSGQFEWRQKGTEYIASYRAMFLKIRFSIPKWIVVLGEPKADALAPMANFKHIFPLVALLALWVVLFLSLSQIRRSLIPLDRLREGTSSIGEGNFAARVQVTSGDEFEELALAFNTMAGRLGRQFNTMALMNEIDRSILSALETDTIVETVLSQVHQLFSCKNAGLATIEAETTRAGLLHIREDRSRGEKRMEHIELTAGEVEDLEGHPESLLIDGRDSIPGYLEPLAEGEARSFMVLPIFVEDRLEGFLSLGFVDSGSYGEEDQRHARQLSDQVAVAISKARLLEQLEELNWGTLYALARAIDAKSSWTAGHSERVTNLALKIGRVMGLSQRVLDDLHRGGLLHDIGKLGIPPHILDKPGRLTPEEFEFMRKHPIIGARILEPIGAYEKVIPIVLQHHEHFDGSGYPEGLAGEDIDLGARIFRVADYYDALISDRPYRSAMPREEVIRTLKEQTGRMFDPEVMEAFLEVMGYQESSSAEPGVPVSQPGVS